MPTTSKLLPVNDLTDTATNAHLLKYDSTYGNFNGTVSTDEKNVIGQRKADHCFC